jgi:hypothetical protein
MQPMIEFTRHMLELIAEFLSKEPVIYLYGMVIFLLIVKIFMTVIRKN